MKFVVHHGDCLVVMRTMPDSSVDSIVTDPPYGLSFMGKRWDYDVPAVEVWAECLRVLKPGGHLLAFAGTRTQHRMAVRIEDAGFEIRDMIAWVYGSGFPKSLDVSKAIDKAEGVEGTFGAPKSAAHAGWIARGRMRGEEGHDGYQRPWMADGDAVDRNARQYIGGTDAARKWQGWGTAIKPALEPITMARKPLAGTVAANVQEYGTGALNIDGCRITTEEDLNGGAYAKNGGRSESQSLHGGSGMNVAGKTAGTDFVQPAGRWPANLIHDGSDEVVALFPQSSGGGFPREVVRSNRGGEFCQRFTDESRPQRVNMGDAGSAARFFYCAKASRKDRNDGCEHMAAKPLHWSSGSQNPGSFQSEGTDKSSQNNHPTVKPTDLMRYLCRLVTPPGGTVLDPFTGSGSTGKAAVLEGFRFVGIEREAEYVEIARARIDFAVKGNDIPQGDLFEVNP